MVGMGKVCSQVNIIFFNKKRVKFITLTAGNKVIFAIMITIVRERYTTNRHSTSGSISPFELFLYTILKFI